MRGAEPGQRVMFSYVDLEQRVPDDHPLRAIQTLVEPVLRDLSPRFAALYAESGRPSIPPEQLLRALLLQVLYTIRSERQLMEQLDYNLLFRWFVGLGMDAPVWHPTTFTKNRDRLLAGQIAEAFFAGVLRQAGSRALLSNEHFTVDGTLLEAWASQKSFRPTEAPPPSDDDPGNPTVSFRGQRRSNATHHSVTDPDARLAKKGAGKEAKLSYQASVLLDNRYGLVVATTVSAPSGTAEVDQAIELCATQPPRAGRRTLGADMGYDQRSLITGLRGLGWTPHIADGPTSILDGRTTRHAGYAESQRRRKRVEESFGWGKTVGLLRKLRHRGRELVDWIFTFTMAAYNLVRLRTLIGVGVGT
ncbi:MAG: IS5 family transposase [Candidatus Limnocylindria bacterium]